MWPHFWEKSQYLGLATSRSVIVKVKGKEVAQEKVKRVFECKKKTTTTEQTLSIRSGRLDWPSSPRSPTWPKCCGNFTIYEQGLIVGLDLHLRGHNVVVKCCQCFNASFLPPSAVFYYLNTRTFHSGATPFPYTLSEGLQIPKIGSNPNFWVKSQFLVHQINRS